MIAVLIEHEDGVVADAAKIAVIRGALLVAMNRALRTVDVEDQRRRSTPSLNPLDPRAVQAHQRCEVSRVAQDASLEPAHLALAGRVAIPRAATNDAAHDRVARQSVGVVHVLIAGQAPEYGLPEQGEKRVMRIPTRAPVALFPGRHLGQAEGLIQLPKQKQAAVGAELGAVELELYPPVEIQTQSIALRLTRNTRERNHHPLHPSP